MEKSLFYFDLPPELIAQVPLEHREDSRLLICNTITQSIEDSAFHRISEHIQTIFHKNTAHPQKVLLIANDSKVYPARVRIKRQTGARGEVFLLENGQREKYSCLLRPQKKLRPGEILYADCETTLVPLFQVVSLDPCFVTPCLSDTLPSFDALLQKYGEMPLPPYIVRDPKKIPASLREVDLHRYQTAYARALGSAAAPTAGLHFTQDIIKKCKENNIEFSTVTLHVSSSTFLPVQTAQIEDHMMHEEFYSLPKETILLILEYVQNNWPIVFVGTTSLRTVESFLRSFGMTDREHVPAFLADPKNRENILAQADLWQGTRLFIHPKSLEERVLPLIGQGILTNFHQPENTLSMLVAALLGYQFWQRCYAHAIQNKYRFFSYGDSSLLIFGDKN